MRKILFLLALLLTTPCVAQQATVIGPVSPCAAFGTAAGTCTQGNDVRLGAGAVTGAIKSNGSNSFGQAASTDLSDVTAPTSFTPTDASGSSIVFSSKSGTYVRTGKWIFVTLSVVYPSIAVDTNPAKIGSLPCTSINVAEGNTQLAAATGASLTLEGIVLQNTLTASVVNLTGASTVTNAQLSLQTVRLSGSYICQ